MPWIMKEVDSLLYVDTDILFLRPVDDIWSLLKKFNSTQIAAMAPEHEEPRIGWYNRFARHPYYGKTGVNSGVMLMNMTRMRRKYFKVSHWFRLAFLSFPSRLFGFQFSFVLLKARLTYSEFFYLPRIIEASVFLVFCLLEHYSRSKQMALQSSIKYQAASMNIPRLVFQTRVIIL